MGPIDSGPLPLDKLLTIGDNEALIRQLTGVLNMDDLLSFSKSNSSTINTTTSKAVIGSTSGKYLGAAEGKTPAQMTKEVMRARNENAILNALQELNRPTSDFVPKAPPTVPEVPKVPLINLPDIIRGISPVVNFLSLMLHSPELNQGETEWLKKRDALENASKPPPSGKIIPLI